MFPKISLLCALLLLPCVSFCRPSGEQEYPYRTYNYHPQYKTESTHISEPSNHIFFSLVSISDAMDNMTAVLSSHDHVTPLDLSTGLSMRHGLDVLQQTITTATRDLDASTNSYTIYDSAQLVAESLRIYEGFDKMLGEIMEHQKAFTVTVQVGDLNGCVKDALEKQTRLVMYFGKSLQRCVVGSFRDMVGTVTSLMVRRAVQAADTYRNHDAVR